MPVFVIMSPVAVVVLVAVGGKKPVFICFHSRFHSVLPQSERTKLVELNDRCSLEIDVVDEVRHPSWCICIERRGISLDDLDVSDRVEIDRFNTGLPVGFRFRDIIQ